MPDSYLGPAVVLSSANATAAIPVEGYGGVAFQIQGTFSGTVTFEATVHGAEFVPFLVTEASGTTAVTTATTAGVFVGSAVGYTSVRARMSAYTSGGASVIIRASPASPGNVSGGGGGGGGGGTSSDFGAAFPSEGTAIGIKDPDGTMQGLSAETFDLDTGAGSVAVTALALALPGNGGPVVGGTVTNPVLTASQAATATLSNVNDTDTSTTLLSSNAARRAAAIVNDSDQILYVKFGTTASTTSYTVKLTAGAYYEFQLPVYTGRVDGIWAANSTGAARITELT